MEKYRHIELSLEKDLGTLTFNRPEQLNAMNGEMMDEIIHALERITGDKKVRAAIITGKGRAFMAGADIKEYAAQTPDAFRDFREKGVRLYELIERAEIPFIAAVNGFALGGGFEIALSCDLIVAAGTAMMGLPEIHLGLIPGGGGTQRLLQKIGLNRVKEMVLLGGSYTAEQMCAWGIVHKVIDEGEVMEYSSQLAEKLLRRSPAALSALKKMLTPEQIERPFADKMKKEGQSVFELFYDPEAQQLIEAFTKKNK
jgi:enoyl-CoA hydratase/carnithine racemase